MVSFGYDNIIIEEFLDQANHKKELVEWVWGAIDALIKRFPKSDHYPIKNKKEIYIAVGVKDPDRKNGERYFRVYLNSNSAGVIASRTRFPNHPDRLRERTFKSSSGSLIEMYEWLKNITEKENINIEGGGRRPVNYKYVEIAGDEGDEEGESDGAQDYIPSDNFFTFGGSLNQILYGPPGTGKTYRTIELAVSCAEPEFTAAGTTKVEKRKSFKDKFDQLIVEKRIRFVTFHQSYGYEEFVEGLSAKTEGDQLSYYEKSGIFKSLCEDAKAYMGENKEVNRAEFDDLWQRFADALAEGTSGIKVKSLSEKTYFTITDISDSTIRFDKAQGKSVHSLSVKTLKAIYQEEKELSGGLKPYYGALIHYLKTTYEPKAPHVARERKNFVLVIDEINRGNISKIFGELITLIEPSKRLGKPEGLPVTLPYTGDSFGVPDNVFIIGTMNTADRSLALMDTALRRRFEFIEMMPDYSALKVSEKDSYCVGSGETAIDLVKLLKTLNNRIAALYDREHMLGHAFFIPVVEKIINGDHEQALDELAKAFKTKIIPLLAEYFFEDWQKIRLVIGDNQKEDKGFAQIVIRSRMELDGLFGDSSELDISGESYTYLLADGDSGIWRNALTYVGMYDVTKLTSL